MPSDPPRTPTYWQAIRAEVLDRIQTRAWPPGTMIPNEADLAREFGCARATMNRALRDLAAAGLLDRRRKAGTRVSLNPARRATLEIPVIQQEVEARGGSYGHALISREHCPPPRHVRSRMGLSSDSELLHLRALHLSDGAPYLFEDRWVNPKAAPGILQIDFTQINANVWLVQNVPYTHGDLALAATTADDEAAAILRCPPQSAIMTMERCTWMHDTPITLVTFFYAPGHRITTRL